MICICFFMLFRSVLKLCKKDRSEAQINFVDVSYENRNNQEHKESFILGQEDHEEEQEKKID